MNFGNRLKAIGAMVPKCRNLVDVGTDHAYLPVLLALDKKIEHAIATDIVPGPCHAARKTVEEYGMGKVIEVRQADGLTGVTTQEAEVVVIAGMGAGTMIDILQQSPEVIKNCSRLILQPMNDSEHLRRWAETSGWVIDQEDLVEEGNKIYEIMRLEQGQLGNHKAVCYQVGTYLIDHHHPLLPKFVVGLLQKYNSLLTAMKASPRARSSAKYEEFQLIKKQLEEIVNEENHGY